MKALLRLIISVIALSWLAACAAPTPAPTSPPIVQTVIVPQTVIATTIPTATARAVSKSGNCHSERSEESHFVDNEIASSQKAFLAKTSRLLLATLTEPYCDGSAGGNNHTYERVPPHHAD